MRRKTQQYEMLILWAEALSTKCATALLSACLQTDFLCLHASSALAAAFCMSRFRNYEFCARHCHCQVNVFWLFHLIDHKKPTNAGCFAIKKYKTQKLPGNKKGDIAQNTSNKQQRQSPNCESDTQQPYFFKNENKKQQVFVHGIIPFPQLCLFEKWCLCELHSLGGIKGNKNAITTNQQISIVYVKHKKGRNYRAKPNPIRRYRTIKKKLALPVCCILLLTPFPGIALSFHPFW